MMVTQNLLMHDLNETYPFSFGYKVFDHFTFHFIISIFSLLGLGDAVSVN